MIADVYSQARGLSRAVRRLCAANTTESVVLILRRARELLPVGGVGAMLEVIAGEA